jgi:hypothetical protein
MAENSREDNLPPPPPPPSVVSLCVSTSPQARAKRKIAALMEEVEILKQDKVTKQRCVCSRPLKAVLMLLIVGKQPIMFHKDEQFIGWLSFTLQ